ncbi:DUF4192 family protein [Arthrobacter sp. Cr_A7]|uniref:DUF4192 family protein n=1 Tax=Arthrobacter sp. Cr_A7 TaxID=3031017 RepID=UPI0023DC67FC|nr:DUF4192 family protein [Arthrobacter sp. Cr_A7]MDF2050720.1 DUF4192 family protein [Arthrobacter sp. Cr_A7]
MEKLTITTPSDVLSFIGHTLGFWPQESLVCITLDENSIGATLRIDLPRQPGQELPYAPPSPTTSPATRPRPLSSLPSTPANPPSQGRPNPTPAP